MIMEQMCSANNVLPLVLSVYQILMGLNVHPVWLEVIGTLLRLTLAIVMLGFMIQGHRPNANHVSQLVLLALTINIVQYVMIPSS